MLVLPDDHKITMLKYKRSQYLALRTKGHLHILILRTVPYLAALSLILKQKALLLYAIRHLSAMFARSVYHKQTSCYVAAFSAANLFQIVANFVPL